MPKLPRHLGPVFLIPPLEEAASILANFDRDVRYIRERCGYLQADLGRALGVTNVSVYHWEKKKRSFHTDRLPFLIVIEWAKALREYMSADPATSAGLLSHAREKAILLISSFPGEAVFIRKRLGLDQAQLGAALGVSNVVLCGWETGRRTPFSHIHFLAIHLWAQKLHSVGGF